MDQKCVPGEGRISWLGVFHANGIDGVVFADGKDSIGGTGKQHSQDQTNADCEHIPGWGKVRGITQVRNLIQAVAQSDTQRCAPENCFQSVNHTFIGHHPVQVVLRKAHAPQHRRAREYQKLYGQHIWIGCGGIRWRVKYLLIGRLAMF